MTAQQDTTSVVESGPEDLAIQRYLLDLALQPIDRFDGFTQFAQAGPSALRFQLNIINYALCMAQYTRTPAFTGYLAEAQRNTIIKMTDRRVWSYWFITNLIGNLRWNPDPIARENVMYSGFFGTMLGYYETLNADRSLSKPGALTLVWNDSKQFHYDFGRIAESIAANMRAKPGYPQFPCEPHMVYPWCNAHGLNTLIMYDRLHHAPLTGDLVDQLRTSYARDGWLRPDGRFIGSGTRKGRRVVPPYLNNDAAMILWLAAAMPDISHDCWSRLRESVLLVNSNGRLTLNHKWIDKIDMGNYSLHKGDAFARAALMAAARELGDEEAAQALERSLNERHESVELHGARRYTDMSMWANGTQAFARFLRADGARDLVLGRIPSEWTTGPILAEAAYPDVLVARAVTDGRRLELVLRPGNGAVRTTLGFERLIPGARYTVSGPVTDMVTAGNDGRARIGVDLSKRLQLSIQPSN